MLKKVLAYGAVVLLAYMIVENPASAVSVVRNVGTAAQGAFQSLLQIAGSLAQKAGG